jgi:hypothetical protein
MPHKEGEPAMNITIPDIPADLNPNGWEVEVSPIGEWKKGNWPLIMTSIGWKELDYLEDSKDCTTGRLVEPKYMFNGELKTESECREILERDYENTAFIKDTAFIKGESRCKGCPFSTMEKNHPAYRAFGGCAAIAPDLYCKPHRRWQKKQPAEPSKPIGPANLPEGHKAYPVVMDDGSLCVALPTGNVPVCDCHNSMSVDGLHLYGWCRDNVASSYCLNAVYLDTEAKWALFRKVEVEK